MKKKSAIELWHFMWTRNRLWMIPIVLLAILVAVLLVAETGPASLFLYPL